MQLNYKNLLLFQLFTIIDLLYVLFVYMYFIAIMSYYDTLFWIISIKYIMAIISIILYILLMFHILYMAVVPDDDHGCISEDEDPQPIRSITPPTPLSPSYPQTEVILMC
jgi:hypothetical protein